MPFGGEFVEVVEVGDVERDVDDGARLVPARFHR